MFLKRKEHKERRKGTQRQRVEIIIFAVLCDATLRFSAVKYFILRQPHFFCLLFSTNILSTIIRLIRQRSTEFTPKSGGRINNKAFSQFMIFLSVSSDSFQFIR